MKKLVKAPIATVLSVDSLKRVRGGAFEGYLEVELVKQGKNKGTSPRK